MPLRITKDDKQPGRVTLMLEGTVMLPWISELYRECLRCSGPDTNVGLDLRGVDYVDEHGVTALRELIHHGVTLLNVPPIIDELLRESTRS